VFGLATYEFLPFMAGKDVNERIYFMSDNLNSWYLQQINQQLLQHDLAQQQLIEQLNQFLQQFNQHRFFTHWFNKPKQLGYYIYGDVGRGKSMIMNAMYQHTTKRKIRQHFHEFMQQIHQQLALSKADKPLSIIAKQLKQQVDIIYLDEMHISDIASAMILQQLFQALFQQNIYVVTSSNYPPDGLWPNGLMRERFFPAIELLKQRLIVTSLNSQQDYRLVNSSNNQLFWIKATNAHSQLEHLFHQISYPQLIHYQQNLLICQRQIATIAYSDNIVWLNFEVICGAQRSQLDYLELAEKFTWFIISDIYPLNFEQKDTARRFTWLIDILYDKACKLALSSTVLLENIYLEGDFINEFQRTLSRLEEMQTKEYLQK
jgi:cell division protein ZapE